jgi:hypothetical protein
MYILVAWQGSPTVAWEAALETGLFGKYLSPSPEEAFEPKLALKIRRLVGDEGCLPIF